MPNEFIARNGIVSRGNLIVSGSLVTTQPTTLSGSLSLTGNLNFQAGATRYVTISSPTSGNGNNLIIQAGSGSVQGTGGNIYLYPGAGAGGPGPGRTYIGDQYGWDGVYVTGLLTVTEQGPDTGTAFRVNAGGNLAMRYDWDNINFVTSAVSAGNRILRFTGASQYQVRGSGTTSSTTALLVQNANASSSLVVNDAGYVGIGASPSATSPVYLYQNTGSSISDLEIFHEYPSSISQRAYANLTLTTKQPNGNHGSQYINFKHVGGNVSPFVGGVLGFDLYDGGTGYSYFQLQTKVSGQSLATRFAIDQNGNTLLGRQGGNELIIITEPTFAATSPLPAKTIGIFSNNQASGWGGFGLIIKAGPANNNLSTNLKGGELYLRAGESLGTGGSDILLQIPTPSGSAGTVLNSTYQTAMFISGSGNVGIGTSTPRTALDVNGIISVGASGSSGNITFPTTVSGFATSIFTTYVNNRLTLQCGSATRIEFNSWLDFISGGNLLRIDGGTHTTTLSTNSTTRFVNTGATGTNTTYFINTDVGINTTSPSAKLHVVGSGATSSTTALLVQNSNASASFTVTDNRIVTANSKLYAGTFTPGANIAANHTIITDGAIFAGGGINVYPSVGAGHNPFTGWTSDGGPLYATVNGGAVLNMNYVGGGSSGASLVISTGYNPGASTGTVYGVTHHPAFYPTADTSIDYISYSAQPAWQSTPYSSRLVGKVRGFYFGNGLYTSQSLVDVRAIDTDGGKIRFNGLVQNAVSGSAYGVSITHTISASANSDTLTGVYIQPTFANGAYTGVNNYALRVSGSTYLYRSGSTVLDVQGSQGQLFSVIDTLSGSLMSVNDISGLPILEVFSDDRVVMGTYGAPAAIVTGSVLNVTGSLVTQGQILDPAFIWFMS